jgi:hypothetical protein
MPTTYHRVCLRCSKPFTTNSNRTRHCSKSCAAITRMTAHGCPPWAVDELELLQDLAGHYPGLDLIDVFQRKAKLKGFPQRTQSAIYSEMSRQRISRRALYDNLSMAELARVLDVHTRSVQGWKKLGMPYHLNSKRVSVIPLKEFKAWAEKYPSSLTNVDADRLLWVLQDRKLVDHIKSSLNHRGIPVPIRRKDTGEVFESCAAAARAAHLDKTAIASAIRQGKTMVGGIEWEVIRG